jgi:hypothetical protein
MASILKVDQLQNAAGTPVVQFDTNGNATFSGGVSNSGYLKLPLWTTETRPSVPETGMIGYNSSEDVLTVEIYNGEEWILIGSSGASKALPAGYKIAMTFESSNGGLLPASTWTISNIGTPGTYVSSGGVDNSGYFSDSGRSVNTNYFRISEMPITGTTTDLTFCIWYKGTQNVSPQTYGPAVGLFGDTRGSVYGGYGISSGKCEFRDSGNAYQGPNVNTGNWVHIAFSMTTGKTLKIYVNGSLTNTYNSVSVTTAYTRCSDIGAHYPYGGYVAPSAIDCPVVYDRILSDAEVLQVYEAGQFTE